MRALRVPEPRCQADENRLSSIEARKNHNTWRRLLSPWIGAVQRLDGGALGVSAVWWLSGSAPQRRWRRLRRRLRRFVGGKPNLKKKSSQIEWRSLDWRLKCTHVHSRTNLPHLSIAFGHCQCYDPILWSLVKPKHLRYICGICTSDFT